MLLLLLLLCFAGSQVFVAFVFVQNEARRNVFREFISVLKAVVYREASPAKLHELSSWVHSSTEAREHAAWGAAREHHTL